LVIKEGFLMTINGRSHERIIRDAGLDPDHLDLESRCRRCHTIFPFIPYRSLCNDCHEENPDFDTIGWLGFDTTYTVTCTRENCRGCEVGW
jgi:hypothetical protein